MHLPESALLGRRIDLLAGIVCVLYSPGKNQEGLKEV